MRDWKGKHVLVIGAARQGLAITRFLIQKGALVIVNDQKTDEELMNLKNSMSDSNIHWVLGSHPLSLLEDIDLVIVSGGVSLTSPIIQEAIHKGIPLSNDSQIFMESVNARVIGITGSSGKTTTTTLVGAIAEADSKSNRQVFVGGNIGLPLVDHLNQINKNDWVILELSSFQLELMTVSPHIAAVLNITPNHLDRHHDMQAYTAAKAQILRYQNSQDFAVLNHEDAGSWGLANHVLGKLVTFGLNQLNNGIPETYLDQGKLYLFDEERKIEIMPISEIPLRGPHNILNTLTACAISFAAGFSTEAMHKGIISITGIPHRLEFVREWRGAQWINDSIATAPERTMAAIQSFDQPLVVLLGGRDKNLPWEELATLIHQRVKHVILFGEAADLISPAVQNEKRQGFPQSITRCTNLHEAVLSAAKIASSGDVVLLSPGGTSFDEFRDFEERGNKFKEWVNALQ